MEHQTDRTVPAPAPSPRPSPSEREGDRELGSVYRELEPRPALREHVACVWYQRVGPDEPADNVQRVLPDACIDVVWDVRGRIFVAGPDTGPVLEPMGPGSLYAGARFRPGRGPEVLGVAALELRDHQPAL
ncbi:MAG TPA: DUF6597 domain-containing transcriptional factor, partial [Candidatus Dormibacteraeota bacterium]|nr:DUF6597 domain-containing transcriptional factor [Candidatus Dormibacteraeota bacterium]